VKTRSVPSQLRLKRRNRTSGEASEASWARRPLPRAAGLAIEVAVTTAEAGVTVAQTATTPTNVTSHLTIVMIVLS
jgi:hypothetical protein